MSVIVDEMYLQWKRAVCHTHKLFPVCCVGVEPEPFEMGEHLIEASGKLCLLDSMLTYLHKGSVSVLWAPPGGSLG